MRSTFLGRILKLAVVAALLTGVYLVFVYRQDIVDRWRLLNYKPTADIAALADAASMEGRGRDLFYASEPEVNSRDEFNTNCTDTGEESLVLGCYSAQRIYIYDVTDTHLKGVKEVTAAHEMLHAAYERLPSVERERLDELLEAQLAQISDERLKGLIDLYNQHEPGQLLNEMHSILGTEFSGLSTGLEEYYKQYFASRGKVVGLANAYSQVFTESLKRIDNYDGQLADLKNQIDVNTSELDIRKAALESQSDQLDALRSSDPEAYNAVVPNYNANVRVYNDLAAKTRNLVSQYNGLVQTRNNEVAAQNDLYHSLDSKYEPVNTN